MPPNVLNRSSISLLLSGLSMLARVSVMAKDNLAIFSDEIKRAFTIRQITTFQRSFQALNFSLQAARNSLRNFKITMDPRTGPKLFEILRSGEFRELQTVAGRSVQELINVFASTQKSITNQGKKYNILNKNIGTEAVEEQGETIVIPTTEDIFAQMLNYIKEGPLVAGIRSFFGGGNTAKNKNIVQQQGEYIQQNFGLEKLGGFVKGIGTVFPKLFGAPFSFLQKTGDHLKDIGIKAWNGMGKLLGVPANKWTALGKGLGPLIGAGMMAGGIGILVSIVMALLDALNPFKPLMEALSDIFGVYGAILSTAFMPLIEQLYELMLSDSTISLLTSLANVVRNVVMAFMPLLNVLLPLGNVILGVLLIPLNLFASVLMTLATPLGMVVNLIAFLFQGLANILAFYWTSVQPAFNSFNELLAAIARWDWEAVKKAAANFIVDVVNGWIRIINAALGWAGVNIKEIPKMAQGGIVTKPTLAIIGEAGPEAVVPLSKGKNNLPKGDIVINIYGDVSEEKLYQLKHELLVREVY